MSVKSTELRLQSGARPVTGVDNEVMHPAQTVSIGHEDGPARLRDGSFARPGSKTPNPVAVRRCKRRDAKAEAET